MSLDVDVLIIGAGMSGLGFAIQLQKTFPHASYEIVEKSSGSGGTWWANTYPGCGCDIPSHIYSYSFDLKPDWSMVFAPQPEILEYFHSVATKHNVLKHITYDTMVQSAEFDMKTGTWMVTIVDQKMKLPKQRRCKVLISAVGALSTPNECGIEGFDRYGGKLFHSAQWDHKFDWAGKDVIVVGNGCSATQFVPVLTGGENRVRKLTQFIRQPHWVIERPNPEYTPMFKWVMRHIPFAMRAYRIWLFSRMEYVFREFYTEYGRKLREDQAVIHLDYMRRTAPARYHDVLTPKTEFGCKRKVMDTDYFACLHRGNMELVGTDPIKEITETGVITKSGRPISADAIILANGFQTQKVLHPLEIKGENGITLAEHWKYHSGNTPQAYFGTCISGFPNFFIMMGPNTATGHSSVISTTEYQINFTLRVIQPVMDCLYPPSLSVFNPFRRTPCDSVAVTLAAEQKDNEWIQSTIKDFVWATGCSSWYMDRTGKNIMLYPDWQWKYWMRSIFIPLTSDFKSESSERRVLGTNHGKGKTYRKSIILGGLGLALVVTFAASWQYDMVVQDIGFKVSHQVGNSVKNLAVHLNSFR